MGLEVASPAEMGVKEEVPAFSSLRIPGPLPRGFARLCCGSPQKGKGKN